MTADEKRELVIAVLRELAPIFYNAESRGNYVGLDDRWEESVTGTLGAVGSAIERRADELSKVDHA